MNKYILVLTFALTACSFWHKDVVDESTVAKVHIEKKPDEIHINRTIVNYRSGPIKSIVKENTDNKTGEYNEDVGLDLRAHKTDEGKVKPAIPILRIGLALAAILGVALFIWRKVRV